MNKKIVVKVVFNLMNLAVFEFMLSVIAWAGTWGDTKTFSQMFLLMHLIVFLFLLVCLTGYFVRKTYNWSVKNK